MQAMKRFVQVGFIAGLLAAGGAFAAEPAAATTNGKPVPTSVDTSGPSQLIESSANIMLVGHRRASRGIPQGSHRAV